MAKTVITIDAAPGRIGVQFVGLTDKAKVDLENWLTDRLEAALPVPNDVIS